jgi:hypothetical protein
MTFQNYSDVIFNAFLSSYRPTEIMNRKSDIVKQVSEAVGLRPKTAMFVGFNPAIVDISAEVEQVFLYQCSPTVVSYLQECGIAAQSVDPHNCEPVDLTVATDEYFTFANDEEEQSYMLRELLVATRGTLLTTVKDYKNQEFKDREYSQPAIIKTEEDRIAYVEIHDWDQQDRAHWQTSVYELHRGHCEYRGQYERRTLFFKQLARASQDLGAKNFLVHKNLMWKSLIKKNYEHVISISK